MKFLAWFTALWATFSAIVCIFDANGDGYTIFGGLMLVPVATFAWLYIFKKK